MIYASVAVFGVGMVILMLLGFGVAILWFDQLVN